MNGRLARGIGANLYGQVVTSAIQLVSIPLLIHAWGTARFGVWVLLSALPMALSFADGGLVLASGNAMTIAVARGDTQAAGALFGRAFRMIGAVVLGGVALTGMVLSLVPVDWWPGNPIVTTAQSRTVLFAIVAVVLVGLLSSLVSAGFRASGRYAVGTMANDSTRLLESTAVLAVATLGGDLAAAASAWLVVRILGTGVSAVALVRLAPWTAMRSQASSHSGLPPLIHPALAALALPAAFSVSLQGSAIALATAVPPSAVAVFAATRTLTRAMVQASGLVNHALMPEMAAAVGRGDAAAMVSISRFNTKAALALLVPVWFGLLLLGPWIVDVWTGHQLRVEPLVLDIMATAALFHGLWLSAANLRLAVNRHADYAWAFLTIAVLSTLAVPTLAARWGLLGAALAVLGGEAAMAAWIAGLRRRGPGGLPLVLREASR